MTIRTHRSYLFIALLIFAAEIVIAIGVPGGTFVRDNLGDLLATALLYCGLRWLTGRTPLACAALAVGLSFAVEALQYLQIADRLGVQPGSVLAVIIGSTFSVADLLMYVLGSALAYVVDQWWYEHVTTKKPRNEGHQDLK